MKAIILAGGMGTRLGKYTENLPKCMLEFQGEPLIQRQVESLRKAGINDITIVKGYKAEKINILGTKEYISLDYATTNMVETLFCAEKEINGDVLICYSDILYESFIIEKILKNKSDIGVVVDDDYWEYWSARMDNPKNDIESLIISENKILELGDTSCDMNKAKERYVGLIKFSAKGAEQLKKVYHKNKNKYFNTNEPWLRSKSFKKAYMTCMLQAIINEGYEINPIHVVHGWIEFDNIEDYERATKWVKDGSIDKFIKLN